MKKRPKIAVILVQKEVAQKISSEVPDASYLSTFVHTFFDVEYLGEVPRSKFEPQPAVDGGILKLVRKETEIDSADVQEYEDFLHRGFRHPRKMINKVLPRELLDKMNISSNKRPHDISPREWVQMFYENKRSNSNL